MSTASWLVGFALLASSYAARAEEGREEPVSSSRREYEMPERLRRQVSPAPSVPWQTPDLGAYATVLKNVEPSPIDPQKRYELAELVDLAERLNPETRVAWERARQAAIAVGLVESEYSPVLSLDALGGYHSEAFPAPKDVAPSGFFRADLEQALPDAEPALAAPRLRAAGEPDGRGQAAPAGREPRLQPQAPGDRLPRPSRVLRA